MSSHSDTAADSGPAAVPPDKSLFAEISPLRLAAGVVFCAFAVGAVAFGWLSPTAPDTIGVALLCLVFLSGGFVPFNTTLMYYIGQSAGFLIWGVLRVLAFGLGVIPLLLGGAGAIGFVVYGRRALRDGFRAQA